MNGLKKPLLRQRLTHDDELPEPSGSCDKCNYLRARWELSNQASKLASI